MRKLLPLLVVCLGTALSASSQCSTANINWDALDFIPTTGYSNANAAAIARNQAFVIGKNRLNIATNSMYEPPIIAVASTDFVSRYIQKVRANHR